MTQLSDIVTINISRETAAVAQTNFNIPAFLSTHLSFKERARYYNSLVSVAADFATTSDTYIAASRLFGQELKPANIVIGRRNVPTANISVATVANTTAYSLTVSDTIFNVTSGGSATAINICAALKIAYDAAPVTGVVLVDNTDGTMTFTASVPEWSLKASANINVVAGAATETWVDAVVAMTGVNNKWYTLCAQTHEAVDILAIANYIEGTTKLYVTSTPDADVLTTATTDVASVLKSRTLFRTALMWSATANTEFPECAWVGSQLQETPGSNTWNYKTVSGVTVSTLLPTASINANSKNCTTIEEFGGTNQTNGSKTSGGEWVDVMLFIDWLQARMVERVWFRMRNSKKVPYTQAGAVVLETEVRAQLSEGVRSGGLADSPKYQVFTPDVLTIAPNLRAQRIFDGMKFEARLAGAIHFVKIQGVVTV